jgi:hypothetical protein
MFNLNETIANRIFQTIQHTLHNGDIVFAKKDEQLIHAFIWSPSRENTTQNLFHVKFSGLVYMYTNAKD